MNTTLNNHRCWRLQLEVKFMLRLVSYTNFLPHSLTPSEDQMKRTSPLSKHLAFYDLNFTRNIYVKVITQLNRLQNKGLVGFI